MMQIEARIASASGGTIATELAAFMREELGAEPTRTETLPTEVKRDFGLTIAIISLVLAVPGALHDSIELAQKARLRERVDKTVAKIRTLCSSPSDSVILLVGHETTLDLRTASPDQIVEAILAARKS